MTNLENLNANFLCGINNDGIKDLNLIELSSIGNSRITKKN